MGKLSINESYATHSALLALQPRVAIMNQQRLAVVRTKYSLAAPAQPTLQPGHVDAYLDELAQARIATLVESYHSQLSKLDKPIKKQPMHQHGRSFIDQIINNTRTYTMPTTELTTPQNNQKFAGVKQSLQIIGTECQNILAILTESRPSDEMPLHKPMSPIEYLVRYKL